MFDKYRYCKRSMRFSVLSMLTRRCLLRWGLWERAREVRWGLRAKFGSMSRRFELVRSRSWIWSPMCGNQFGHEMAAFFVCFRCSSIRLPVRKMGLSVDKMFDFV